VELTVRVVKERIHIDGSANLCGNDNRFFSIHKDIKSKVDEEDNSDTTIDKEIQLTIYFLFMTENSLW
jgi:hypothetical protein